MYSLILALATPTSAPWTLFQSSHACACTDPLLPATRLTASRRWATSDLWPERARKHEPPDERRAEEQLRPLSEVLTPISGGVDLVFQLLQVRTQALAGAVDLHFYFVGCFIHSRFSLTDSTVRSGMGLNASGPQNAARDQHDGGDGDHDRDDQRRGPHRHPRRQRVGQRP